jgi:cardiolipin synthase
METETPLTATIVFTIFLIDLIIRIWLLVYIPKNRKPTAATAWLLLIYVAPLVGTLFFFIIGSTKLSRRRRGQQASINQTLQRYTKNLRQAGLVAPIPHAHQSQAVLSETLGLLAPTIGNNVIVINGYTDIISDMVKSIDTATDYVYVEFFAMTLDDATTPFFDALDRARKRGVHVYVLFDTLGSKKYKGYKPMQERLSAMGAKWHKILPIRLTPSQYNRPDLRNHRKIVVVDNTFAYIGSLNMITETYHRKDDISYIELVSRMEGPVVNECAAVFASDWYSETGQMLDHFMTNSALTKKGTVVAQILPSGPGYVHENNLKLFVSLIHSAQKSVLITNPYLVPEESLLSAITSAVLRGVEVSILNSEAIDQWMVGHAQRSYYEQLLAAGVTISLYKKPKLLHSKYMVIDQDIAIIGSSNMDVRSFALNHECTSIFYDKKIANILSKQHRSDKNLGHTLILKQWKKRKLSSSFLDSIARLTSALQ